MEERFNIPPDKVFSAFYFLLTELHAQNQVMIDMLLPMYSKVNDLSMEDTIATFEKDFQKKREKIQRDMQLYFGDITLDDILGGEKK